MTKKQIHNFIKSERLSGASAEDIALGLNHNGGLTPTGKPWTRLSIGSYANRYSLKRRKGKPKVKSSIVPKDKNLDLFDVLTQLKTIDIKLKNLDLDLDEGFHSDYRGYKLLQRQIWRMQNFYLATTLVYLALFAYLIFG